MISVELWRARIGTFNSKRYSGFLSSLFSSHVPFKFHRRRRRYAAKEQPPAAAAASHSAVTQDAEPLFTSASNSATKVRTIINSLKNFLFIFTFFWSSFLSTSSSSFSSLLRNTNRCLLREALVRLILLIVIISQALIISGDVETNPGPSPGEYQ